MSTQIGKKKKNTINTKADHNATATLAPPISTIVKTHDPPSSKPTLTHVHINHNPTTARERDRETHDHQLRERERVIGESIGFWVWSEQRADEKERRKREKKREIMREEREISGLKKKEKELNIII